MTYAPADLLGIRAYAKRFMGLPDDALGIVGDPDHLSVGGYHLGNDDLARIGRLTSDYSKRESPRDQPGTNAASADDTGNGWGRGGVARARQFDRFLVGACQRRDPRAAPIREIIYSPDGRGVSRWDALGIRTTGDSSHRYHTHKSYFRATEGTRDHPGSVLGLYMEFFEGITLGSDGRLSMQMLIKANDSSQIWLADGMFRRPIPAEWVGSGAGPISNLQVHQAGFLGLLGNGGNVFTTGPTATLDVWGVDIQAEITNRVAELAAADVARDAAARAAIDALAAALGQSGGNVDVAPILARMDELAAQESRTVAGLIAEVNSLRVQLAAASRAAADQLQG